MVTSVPIAVASFVIIGSCTFITGLVVSTIVIVCCAVETLPFSSVAVQVTTVDPNGKSIGASFNIDTLKISVAVACPISTGVLTAVASAFISAGTVNTGLVVSFIVIFCSFSVTFPFSSVAVHFTILVPTG